MFLKENMLRFNNSLSVPIIAFKPPVGERLSNVYFVLLIRGTYL